MSCIKILGQSKYFFLGAARSCGMTGSADCQGEKVTFSSRKLSEPAGDIGSLPSLGMVKLLTIPRDGKSLYLPARFSCTQNFKMA